MARRAHVRVDATVGAVRAPPHLRGLVDLDVFDDERVHIQTLRDQDTGETAVDHIWTSSPTFLFKLTMLTPF